MTIRIPWLAHLFPWVVLVLALQALAGWVNPRVERVIAEAEQSKDSSKLPGAFETLRAQLEDGAVYQFIYGRPLPLPTSYLRRAWEDTWCPRLFALVSLGGGLLCLTWNVLLNSGGRGKSGAVEGQAERRVAIVLGAGAMAAIALFALPMLTRSVYIYGDLAAQNLPWRKFFADSLARGDDPTWCPLLNCGFDLHGEGQAGLYHPWQQFLYRTLPLDLAFDLEIVAGYIFAFAGMVCLLRRWRLAWASTLFGAFTFTFGMLFRRYSHINVLTVASHIPWLLLCIDVLASNPDRRKVTGARVGLSLLTASQLLLGHPQFVWYSVLIEVLYLVACIGRTRSLKVAGDYALSKTIGLMLGALQVFPTLESLRASSRWLDHAALLDKTAFGSLHPLNFLLLVCPYAFVQGPFIPSAVPETVFSPYVWPPLSERNAMYWPEVAEFSLYAGLTPMVLILGLVACRSRTSQGGPRHVNAVAFCGLLIAVGAALALGRFSPLFVALSWVPVVNVFRCAARYSLLVALGLAIGSAYGLERLCRTEGRPAGWTDRSILVPAGVLLFANLLGVFLNRTGWRDPNGVLGDLVTHRSGILLNPILAATILGLVVLARRGVRSAVVLLALAHVADLSFYDFSGLYRRQEIWTPTVDDLVAADMVPPAWYRNRVFCYKPPLPGEPPGRSFQNYRRNLPSLRGVQVANGYMGLPPRSPLDYQHPEVQRVAGVAWVLPSWVIADAKPAKGDPLPEFRLVSQVRASDDPSRELATIDVETTALVPEGEGMSVGPGRPGSVQVGSQSNGEHHVRTRADSSQLLVVAIHHHPGWKARIDGVPAKVIQVNGDFMGCVVPVGQHQVVLRWEPSSLQIGWAVTALGLVLLMTSLLLPVGVLPWFSRVRGRNAARVNGGGNDAVKR